jgi:hypothetical protein
MLSGLGERSKASAVTTVVPANTGTHTPRPIDLELLFDPFA